MIKLKPTKDGSSTAYNSKFDETYHSVSGAWEEAMEKHVLALGVEDGMQILDFCFGLGYNSLAATYMHKNLKITALEIDPEIVRIMNKIIVPDYIEASFRLFAGLINSPELTDENNNTIKLVLGDATKSVHTLSSNTFERVFFDPFSPGKHPQMWSEEVFAAVFKAMKPGAKLSTYSCAGRVRRAMKAVGFEVIDGPTVGRRSPATIAIKPEGINKIKI